MAPSTDPQPPLGSQPSLAPAPSTDSAKRGSGSMLDAARALAAKARPTGGATDRMTRRQFTWCTAAMFISSWVSGALNMLLLLASLSAGHSILQVAIIFSGFQFAGALGAVAAGNMLAQYGLRTVLSSALFLQALAQALFIPLKHSHPDRPPGRGMTLTEATIYGTAIQLLNGFARVFARLASKTMPRLAEPPAKKAADERGLLLKTAIVSGGRTFVRGSGFLIGGVLLQYVSYTWGLVILTLITLPACFIPVFTVPEHVGRSDDVKWDWGHLMKFSPDMYTISGIQLLQNAGQYAWLQVPITHMLRSPDAAFRMSHVTVSAVMSGIMCYEGLQQSLLGLPLLKALRQNPPFTNKWVMCLWAILSAAGGVPLAVVSLATALFANPPEETRAVAFAIFFVCLLTMIMPTQMVNVLGSFVYQHFTDRTRVGPSSGFNTMAQAAGRGLGTLASGILFEAIYRGSARHTTPVPGFGASIVFTVATNVIVALMSAFLFPTYGAGGLHCGPCLRIGGTMRTLSGRMVETGSDGRAVAASTKGGKAPAAAPSGGV